MDKALNKLAIVLALLLPVNVDAQHILAPLFVNGYTPTLNHARQFNGTSDYLNTVSNLAAVNGISIFSASFDLYWNAFANDDSLAIESSTSWSTNAGSFVVDPNSSVTSSSGSFMYSIASAPTSYLLCYFPRPSAATWHHYVVTISMNLVPGVGCGAAYVDGVAQTVSQSTTTGPSATTLQTLPWYFMSRAGTTLFGAGRLSNIALYNGTVSSTDAANLAACASPLSVSSATLVAYWKINQTSPEVATTGGVNLTVNGTTTVNSVCLL